MDESMTPEVRARLARALRHHLQALARAGIDRIPCPELPARKPPSPKPRPVREALPQPSPREAPATRPAPIPAPPLVRASSPTPVLPASLFEDAGPSVDAIPAEQRPALLQALAAEVANCVRCPHLAASRTQTVFGEGSPTARLMFIGEAPGETEDQTGRPFVGRAGQLLDDMITKGMGLSREDVYIANILKSRPPNNRDPLPDEVRNCLPYLDRQIAIVRPTYLCILGKPAASALLETSLPLGRLRGKWHKVRGISTIVTYHPAYLLRNPAGKKDSWEDLKLLMKAMRITPPSRKTS